MLNFWTKAQFEPLVYFLPGFSPSFSFEAPGYRVASGPMFVSEDAAMELLMIFQVNVERLDRATYLGTLSPVSPSPQSVTRLSF